MENKRGQLMGSVIAGIGFLVIMTIILLVVISNTNVVYNDLNPDSTGSEYVLADNSTVNTLAQTPTGAVTSTVSNSTYLVFSGADAVTIADNSALDLFRNYSISLWYNWTNGSVGATPTILNKSGAYAINFNVNSAEIQFEYTNATNTNRVNLTTSINQWTHFVVVVNDLNVTLYNNTEVHILNNTLGSATATATSLIISAANANNLSGNLDEIRIYNRTLTAGEVSQIHSSGRVPNSTLPSNNLTAWYRFNAGQGAVAYDSSTGSNTGTVSGAAWTTDGVSVTLTSGTDYTASGKTYTIINANYGWNRILASYSFLGGANTVDALTGNFTKGIDNVSAKIPTILLIFAVVMILGVLALLMKQSNSVGLGFSGGQL